MTRLSQTIAHLSHRTTVVAVGLSLALVAGSSVTAAGEALELVVDGTPRATILLDQKPTVSAQLAAHELQYHIQKMSGATLPIVREPQAVTGTMVLVGESEATKKLGLKNADFAQTEHLIEVATDGLVLMGKDSGDRRRVDYNGDLKLFCQYHSTPKKPVGTCHAVHTFLEKTLGVRWYLPTELGEVIPERKTIKVARMKIRRKVDAPYRHAYPWAINKRLYYSDYKAVDWQHDEHWDLRSGVLYWIRNKQWGGPVIRVNHSFAGWDKVYGQDHPEWFSTKNSEKMKTLHYQMQVNPCLSQKGVSQANLKIIRDFFSRRPAAHPNLYHSAGGEFFGICLNDNGSFCRCAECVQQYRPDMGPRGSLANYFWNYTNRLARDVRKTHPRAWLIGLAYMAYTDPPEGIKFGPNVGVMICRMPYRYWNQGYKDRDYDDIRRFMEDCGAGRLFTWEYLLHPWVDSNPFPPVIPRINAEDAKHLTNIPGFGGGYMQLQRNRLKKDGKDNGDVWSSPVLDHFRLYFRLKLYDDKTLDVEEMLSDYYAKFYGPAAGQVREFIEALEGRWCDKKVRQASGALPYEYGSSNARVWWEFLGTPDFIKKAEGLMAKAQKAAPAGSVYARRVDLLDKGIMQLILNNRRNYAGSGLAQLPALPQIDVPIGSAPTIDGRGDDRPWQHVAWQKITRTNMNKGASSESRFKAVADGHNLYLLVECTERFTERIVAQMEGSGPAVLSDDSLEIFIDRDPGDGKYYQLGYNSLGSVFDSRVDRTGTEKNAATWTSDSKVKATLALNEHWTAEIAIPWKNISGGAVTAGQTWRLNVCRNRKAGREDIDFTNWSVCGGGFHNPARFGKITFKVAGAGGQ